MSQNQSTFWDGDEREYRETIAKIKISPFLPPHKDEAKPKPKKKDFRIHKESRVEEAAAEEKEAETPSGLSECPEVPMTAEHLAAQLVKLWKMGVIKKIDDPDIMFYCLLIKESGGMVVDPRERKILEQKSE